MVYLHKTSNEISYAMVYYINKTIKGIGFYDAIDLVTEALKEEGFGIITEIDVKETFKKKIDIDFKRYTILGACNPKFAYEAIRIEDKLGLFLPCNVVVSEEENSDISISAVDPIASMAAVDNEKLGALAVDIRTRLERVIESL